MGGGGGGGGEGSPEDSPQFPAFSQKDFSENRLQVPGTVREILTLGVFMCVGLIRTSVANWLIVRLHKSKGAEKKVSEAEFWPILNKKGQKGSEL